MRATNYWLQPKFQLYLILITLTWRNVCVWVFIHKLLLFYITARAAAKRTYTYTINRATCCRAVKKQIQLLISNTVENYYRLVEMMRFLQIFCVEFVRIHYKTTDRKSESWHCWFLLKKNIHRLIYYIGQIWLAEIARARAAQS